MMANTTTTIMAEADAPKINPMLYQMPSDIIDGSLATIVVMISNAKSIFCHRLGNIAMSDFRGMRSKTYLHKQIHGLIGELMIA